MVLFCFSVRWGQVALFILIFHPLAQNGKGKEPHKSEPKQKSTQEWNIQAKEVGATSNQGNACTGPEDSEGRA